MKKVSILVADDDASIRNYLTRFLTSCGYEVEAVESGEAAIARLGNAPSPDLVLLDVMMPGVDGIDVLKTIRAHPQHKDLPVVVYSALSDPDTVDRAQLRV